jgi:hypothetical protein
MKAPSSARRPRVVEARRALLIASAFVAFSAPACWPASLLGRCEKDGAEACGDVSPSVHRSRLGSLAKPEGA